MLGQNRSHYLYFTNSEGMSPWSRALCAFLTSESWPLGGSGFGHCSENKSFGGNLGSYLIQVLSKRQPSHRGPANSLDTHGALEEAWALSEQLRTLLPTELQQQNYFLCSLLLLHSEDHL